MPIVRWIVFALPLAVAVGLVFGMARASVDGSITNTPEGFRLLAAAMAVGAVAALTLRFSRTFGVALRSRQTALAGIGITILVALTWWLAVNPA